MTGVAVGGGLFTETQACLPVPGRCTRSVSLLALAVDVEAHGTNDNILSRYRGTTAKQTPVTVVTAGFQENEIPIPRESHGNPAGLYRSHSRATL